MQKSFADPDFDYEFRCALGDAAHGVGDPGMWLATAAGIADGDRPGWFAAWTARGDQLAALAPTLTDPTSAAWAWRSASAAYSRAVGAVVGLPAEQADAVLLPTFRASRRCWEAMINAGDHVRIEVPYDDTTLPAWLLRPDTTGTPRPTLVITNGSDGLVDQRVGRRRGGRARTRLERRRLRRTRPAVDAVRTEHPVPAGLGGRPDPGRRRARRPLRRRTARGLRDQPGRLLAAAGAGVRAPARRRGRRPGVVDVSTSWTAYLPAR